MGFLHKLWDETLAGPPPDAGLGKLRKYNSFPASSTVAPPPLEIPEPADGIPVTRSITVLRNNVHRPLNSPTPPSSPAGSSSPTSPYSPSNPGGNFKKYTKRKLKHEASLPSQIPDAESKNRFDWIVMQTALDH